MPDEIIVQENDLKVRTNKLPKEQIPPPAELYKIYFRYARSLRRVAKRFDINIMDLRSMLEKGKEELIQSGEYKELTRPKKIKKKYKRKFVVKNNNVLKNTLKANTAVVYHHLINNYPEAMKSLLETLGKRTSYSRPKLCTILSISNATLTRYLRITGIKFPDQRVKNMKKINNERLIKDLELKIQELKAKIEATQ